MEAASLKRSVLALKFFELPPDDSAAKAICAYKGRDEAGSSLMATTYTGSGLIRIATARRHAGSLQFERNFWWPSSHCSALEVIPAFLNAS